MIEQALFHDSVNDALKDVIKACGGFKGVGQKLWPEKTVEAATRLLANCVNDDRAERLTPDQVLFILRMGREIGCHAAMAYIAGEAGYQAIPVEPEDEKAKLQREFIESVKQQSRNIDRLERLGLPVSMVRAA